MTFFLIQRLYETVTESNFQRTRIQLIPGDTEEIISHSEDGVCDVGLTKRTYLAIFKEGHSCFEPRYGSDNTQRSHWDTYYASLAVLTTTNEHMTAWRVHEDVVWSLYRTEGRPFLQNEARYMMALGTSQLARINKSLVLWCWIRKLYVASAFANNDCSRSLEMLMEQVLQAMQVHFQNYAAGFTAAWILHASSPNKKILEMVRVRCMESVTDVSLWTLMGTLLLDQKNEAVVDDYRRIRLELENRGMVGLRSSEATDGANLFDRGPITKQLLLWLLAIEAPYETPYNQLLRHDQPRSFRSECLQKMASAANEALLTTLAKVLKRWYPEEPNAFVSDATVS